MSVEQGLGGQLIINTIVHINNVLASERHKNGILFIVDNNRETNYNGES